MTQKVYEHAFPERLSKKDFFTGEYRSNAIATVTTRREGVIRDVLVDVGDSVQAGQVLATLLAPGVDKESEAKVREIDTTINAKSAILQETRSLSDARIAEQMQKIREKEATLGRTRENYAIRLQQIVSLIEDTGINEDRSLSRTAQDTEVERSNLAVLKSNLEQARFARDAKLAERDTDISQQKRLLDNALDESLRTITPFVYIGNLSGLDYDHIDPDTARYLGNRNTDIRNTFFNLWASYTKDRPFLDPDSSAERFIVLTRSLVDALKNTVTSSSITSGEIQSAVASVNTEIETTLTMQDRYHDAISARDSLEATESEKIRNIEVAIEKQQAVITLKEQTESASASGRDKTITNLKLEREKLESEETLQLEKLEEEIKTLRSGLETLRVSETKNIVSLESEIRMARATRDSVSVQAEDLSIVAPFSGVISARGVNPGDMISPSMDAFKLTDVDTTLRRISGSEVYFLVPELFQSDIEDGAIVRMYTPNNPATSWTGSVYRRSQEIDSQTRTFSAQASINTPVSLAHGTTVRVELETLENQFRIPSSAIYERDGRIIVYYQKDNGKLGVRDVNLVSEDSEFSVVSGDINETLPVITTPIFVK
ncbi:MAG TPA: efflux RND transporter periplasmic adaptor subunit [bacterium]|nr:efflux RND transporter periplasmic adaptor subunit [bacterium]